MRIAFTIILNGKHHLLHKNYYKFMLENFDYWAICEGASRNKGSTKWCKPMPEKYYDHHGSSVDGTMEFLKEIKNDKTGVVFPKRMWESKDEQVNAALTMAREFRFRDKNADEKCFLWEIDIDEQWNKDSLDGAEKILVAMKAKTGQFLCNYYVGEDSQGKKLVARGEWGEGKRLPYRRLWDWGGEMFISHEPPELEYGNGITFTLPQRFNHYAYYFEQDVKFKSEWYSGHERIYENWLNFKNMEFPCSIGKFIDGYWGNSKTVIVKE